MPDTYEDGCEEYLLQALMKGIEIIGGNINATVWKSRPEDQIDRMFEIANRFDCDMDMHIDNADDARAFALPYLAEKTIKEQYQGRVAAGHAVGIAHVADHIAYAAMERIREAGITITVLPTRMRLTRVEEFIQHGVNVAMGTDNIRDVFVYLGNADMIETMLLMARILNVGSEAELEEIYKMATVNAAKAARLAEYGIREGCPADLVIFKARSPAETIITQAKRLYVIKNGSVVAEDGELVKKLDCH
jgi:cytosine deaminase